MYRQEQEGKHIPKMAYTVYQDKYRNVKEEPGVELAATLFSVDVVKSNLFLNSEV